MDAGQLDQRLTFQAQLPGQDARGQASGQWVTAFTCWGAAEPLRGREFFAAAQLQSEVTVRFRIRWRAGVHGRMRVLWRGQPYEIEGDPIDIRGERRELQVMCRSGVRAGR